MVVIAKHQSVLARLGLTTLDQCKRFEAETIEHVAGKGDVLRIRTQDENGRELVLFLKRHWRAARKDGIASVLRHGRVWSLARQEWENARAMQEAGFRTAALVAYAEECGPLWEKFSCLVTEAATGSLTVAQFLREGRDFASRRRVFDALAREVRRMHAAGLSMPDLFTRHVFFDPGAAVLEFCFIDMARLDRGRSVSTAARVRALAALHVSAPLRSVSTRERLRFLRRCAGHTEKAALRALAHRLEARTRALLERKKYRDFLAPADRPATKTPDSRH